MANMEGEQLKTALEQDTAQKNGKLLDLGKKMREELGLPPEATDAEVQAKATAMAIAANAAASQRVAGKVLDETTAAVQGKAGAETIAINPAAMVIQIEQKTALLAKIVASALVETARSMLPELMQATLEKTIQVTDPKTGVKQKQTIRVHDVKEMDEILGTMKYIAQLSAEFDLLGDKTQARVPVDAIPSATVQATPASATAEVTDVVPAAAPASPAASA
jgi:hypothetical protein